MWLHGDGGNDLWSGGQMDAWGDRSTNGVTEEVVDGLDGGAECKDGCMGWWIGRLPIGRRGSCMDKWDDGRMMLDAESVDGWWDGWMKG